MKETGQTEESRQQHKTGGQRAVYKNYFLKTKEKWIKYSEKKNYTEKLRHIHSGR